MSQLSILCIGPIWSGSNAGAMFKALGRQGAVINIVDEFYHIPLQNKTFASRLVSKVFRKTFVKSYNIQILKEFRSFNPKLVLVYKGAFVTPETIKAMKLKSQVVCFYPDVSFHTHGNYLKQTLPLYKKVFTTKTFGIHDLNTQLGQSNGVFIPHGFDPEVHKKSDISIELKEKLNCDASFIGTWSPHKEEYLTYLVRMIPKLKLKIWGSQWFKAHDDLKPYVQNTEIIGQLYALAIQCSSINIALLSERVDGASDGDRITSRTFHIPASGGFMLHQNSSEIGEYFELEKEISVFDSKEELVEKINFYLGHSLLREEIQRKGYERANRSHSLDERAKILLGHIQ
jgi:spore maturation protein CgeB